LNQGLVEKESGPWQADARANHPLCEGFGVARCSDGMRSHRRGPPSLRKNKQEFGTPVGGLVKCLTKPGEKVEVDRKASFLVQFDRSMRSRTRRLREKVVGNGLKPPESKVLQEHPLLGAYGLQSKNQA